MKNLSLALTLCFWVSFSQAAQFNTIKRCETAQKVSGSELIVEVQSERTTGELRLVITPSGADSEIFNAKLILPPKMSAGAPARYIAVDAVTKNKITLALSSTPAKINNSVGRYAKLTVDTVFKDLLMLCVNVE